MESKISSKQILSLSVLIGLIFSLTMFLNFILHGSALIVDNATVQTQQTPRPTIKQPSYGLPVRLKIPEINVDTIVEYVGLDSDGAMDVPKNRDNVAWFELGQRPGNNGSAVISGHYGWQNMKGSIFDDLHKLSRGDKISIEDEKGEIITFIVRESRRYNPTTKKTDNADIFGSLDGKSHLNLITCEGEWDERLQQYSKRLVVFADREESPNSSDAIFNTDHLDVGSRTVY